MVNLQSKAHAQHAVQPFSESAEDKILNIEFYSHSSEGHSTLGMELFLFYIQHTCHKIKLF